MARRMQYELFAAEKGCHCGGKMVFDGEMMVCVECYGIFCPGCFSRVITDGGCFACSACGWSACS